MFVAGIDAHATYSVTCVVSNGGELVHGPVRIKNAEADQLTELLKQFRPLEVVVETSPAWPWLFDRLHGGDVHFVLAHAKRLRVIATETLPIKRFRTPPHLVSYAGLAPRSSQSGLRPIRHGSIPAGANRWLRGSFVRAVVSHTAHTPDSWLSQSYDQMKQRLGWQVARIATARRLARAVHAMLRTGEAWRDQPVSPQH